MAIKNGKVVGTSYTGQDGAKFGGFHRDSSQPKSAWNSSGKVYQGNMGEGPASKSGSLLGKGKFKSTCKDCGGKM